MSKQHLPSRNAPGMVIKTQSRHSRLNCKMLHLYPLKKKIIGNNANLANYSVQFSRSVVSNSVTPGIARQASLSITNSQSLPKLMSIEPVMPSNHLILCRPLLLPPIPPSIRVFSNESTLHIRWPKYWSFSFSISSSKEHPGLISFSQVIHVSDQILLCWSPSFPHKEASMNL